MNAPAATHDLDAPPTSDQIRTFREEAADSDESVVVAYVLEEGTKRQLTVSPRGTCVLLEGNTTSDAFPPNTDLEQIAEACRA